MLGGAYLCLLGWVAGCIFCSHSELRWSSTLRVSARLLSRCCCARDLEFVPCLTPVSLPLGIYLMFSGADQLSELRIVLCPCQQPTLALRGIDFLLSPLNPNLTEA
jgi:hypothetical protein